MTPNQAKNLIAGPLGEEMQKFPLRFCKPIYFGPPPSRAKPGHVNNGTASLLRWREEYFAVTCWHVIDHYRARLAREGPCLFAISECYLDPLAQLVNEDRVVDLAVLRLTQQQVMQVRRGSNEIGRSFYELTSWPPLPPRVGQFVAFGGFPGSFREAIAYDELSFGSYSSGAARVTDMYSDYITCQFERAYWIKHFGTREPESLGGLSGGPAFTIRHSAVDILSYEFAGIIYAFDERSESLHIRRAHSIPLGI